MATSIESSRVEAGVPVVDVVDELGLAVARTSIDQRSVVKRNFEGPATGAQNTVYVVKFPSAGHVFDIGSAVLRLDNLQCTMVAGVQPRFEQGAWVILQQVVLRVGGKTVTTLSDFNLKASVAHYLRTSPVASGLPIYGVGSAAERQIWATQARSYEIPLSMMFSAAHWPTWLFGAAELELHFAASERCLEATGATTTPTYSFNASRSYLAGDVITLRAGQRQALEANLAASHGGKLAIVFESYRLSKSNVAAATTQFDAVSPIRSANVKKIWAIQRVAATLQTVTTLQRLSDYVVNNLTRYQGEVDNFQVPGFEIIQTPGTDSYESYKFCIIQGGHGHHGGGGAAGSAADDSTLVNYAAFDGTDPSGFSKSIIILDFTRADPETGLLSGISTINSASDSRVHLTYGAAGATAACEVALFVIHDIRLTARLGQADLIIES